MADATAGTLKQPAPASHTHTNAPSRSVSRADSSGEVYVGDHMNAAVRRRLSSTAKSPDGALGLQDSGGRLGGDSIAAQKNALFTLRVTPPRTATAGSRLKLQYLHYSRQTLLSRINEEAARVGPLLPFRRCAHTHAHAHTHARTRAHSVQSHASAHSYMPSLAPSMSSATYGDLRLIDPALEFSQKATVLLRASCLILSLAPFHAVVTHSAAWIFPQPGADEVLLPLLDAFDKWSYAPSDWALAACGIASSVARAHTRTHTHTTGQAPGSDAADASTTPANGGTDEVFLPDIVLSASPESPPTAADAPAKACTDAWNDLVCGRTSMGEAPAPSAGHDTGATNGAAAPTDAPSAAARAALRAMAAAVATADLSMQFAHAVLHALLTASQSHFTTEVTRVRSLVHVCVSSRGIPPEVHFEKLQQTRTECTALSDRLERMLRAAEQLQHDEDAVDLASAAADATSALVMQATSGASAAPRALSPMLVRGANGAAAVSSADADRAAPSHWRADGSPSADELHLSAHAWERLRGGIEKAMSRTDELLDDFTIEIGHLLSDAKLEMQALDNAANRLNLSLANTRNRMLRVQITLQLVAVCLAFCSMLSGYYGMNLDNGGCGPDGCHGGSAADHGYSRFQMVAIITTMLALAFGLTMFFLMNSYLRI